MGSTRRSSELQSLGDFRRKLGGPSPWKLHGTVQTIWETEERWSPVSNPIQIVVNFRSGPSASVGTVRFGQHNINYDSVRVFLMSGRVVSPFVAGDQMIPNEVLSTQVNSRAFLLNKKWLSKPIDAIVPSNGVRQQRISYYQLYSFILWIFPFGLHGYINYK